MITAQEQISAIEAAYEAMTIGQLVSLRARTHGSKTAINLFERGEQATFAELDNWSNRCANALSAVGVKKGDRVAAMLPNRIEYPILWFALAKLGAVIVPVNTRYTAREVEYVLSDTQAAFAVVDHSVLQTFRAMEPWPAALNKVFVVGGAEEEQKSSWTDLLGNASDAPVASDVSPLDIINIQFTSGTTGFPKGCILTQEYWMVSVCGSVLQDRRPYERYLSWQAFSYVDAQMQILRSIWQGGTLFLASQMSSSKFLAWLIEHRIQWCAFPELVVCQPETPSDRETSLDLVHCQGGWNEEAIRRLMERFGVVGHNNYGSTEMGWGTITPGATIWESAGFGVGAPFRSLRLVDEEGIDIKAGSVGELWISGRGMFSGYWNRPDANAELFEGEWFKTGDLMRRDEAGFYWLVGRTKDMIRRSGENIAAREVESVIRELPQVEDVAAIAVKDSKRGEEVKVVIELKAGLTNADVSPEDVIAHTAGRLATFKIPRYIAFVTSLPRTSSNKIQKSSLSGVADPLAGSYDREVGRWL
jgi:acyl-CoA synthetase (AMP-forming)/AMP-acid ligase II